MNATNWQTFAAPLSTLSTYDREQHARHFCSGVNAPGEVEGLAGHSWVGIAVLGIGPESKRYARALEAIRSVNPSAPVTTDSNSIRRLVGRTNGRGGGARALTAAQDKARAAGAAGQELKRRALSAVYFAELRADVDRRAAMGWLDDEGC